MTTTYISEIGFSFLVKLMVSQGEKQEGGKSKSFETLE